MNSAVLQLRDTTLTLRPGIPLVGRFRKDFVGALTGRRPAARLAGTLAAIGEGVDAGGSILRVHDVAEVIDFLAVRRALRREVDIPADLHLAEALRREQERPGTDPSTASMWRVPSHIAAAPRRPGRSSG